jgi:hypothetical protein
MRPMTTFTEGAREIPSSPSSAIERLTSAVQMVDGGRDDLVAHWHHIYWAPAGGITAPHVDSGSGANGVVYVTASRG